jgi:Mrp family chromosome partitioning ATPase
MSAIDRAFIRAYEIDEGPPSSIPPAPESSARSAGQTMAPPAIAASAPPLRMHALPAPGATAPLRRPLSTFAPAAPAVEARFRPGLEVDEFRWSAVSHALVSSSQTRWQSAVNALLAADDAGCSLIGVGAAARGAGATTIAGCLARLLVAAGKSVALVDGDFATAGLARSLGLAADIGWEDVLAGRAPLADAVIHSLGDGLAVLPLVQGGVPAAEKLDGIHASITAGVLRYHYDVVLFDLGDVASNQQSPAARRLARRCRLDGLLLATAGHAAPAWEERLAHAAPELSNMCLGVIQNQLIAA